VVSQGGGSVRRSRQSRLACDGRQRCVFVDVNSVPASRLILYAIFATVSGCVRTSEEARAQVSVGTAALLEYLHQQDDSQHMEHEYTFCLGADAFLDLTADKWKESERVLQLLQGRFLVLHRVDSERENGQGEVSAIELRDRVAAVPGATLVSVPSLGAVSSSRVRDAVDAGEWASLKDEHVMHPQVLDYIRQQGLYTST
jgi:nicotinic acid mononucleotide adenylyltransferase